jgi:Fe-S-cluster containining protein
VTDDLRREVGQAVMAARGRADVRAAVEAIYAQVAAAVDASKPRCDASGRCCRFDQYGHRLYVTTMELAVFVDSLSEWQARPAGESSRQGVRLHVRDARATEEGCQYQVEGLCSVHAIRPFGCRMFYCDPSAEQWQQEQYERFHAMLKREHERLGVAYAYVEWRAALGAVLAGDG